MYIYTLVANNIEIEKFHILISFTSAPNGDDLNSFLNPKKLELSEHDRAIENLQQTIACTPVIVEVPQ